MFKKKIDKVVCINGHYFDRNRFDVCPVCGAASKSQSIPQPQMQSAQRALDQTEAFLEPSMEAAPKPKPAAPVRREAPQPVKQIETEPASAEEPPFLSFEMELQRLRHEEPAHIEEKTEQAETLEEQIRQTRADLRSPLPATMSYYNFDEIVPPVGWLVCVEGKERGKAFACKAGKNRIGRDETLEISLMQDQTVSRKPQAVVIYDPVNRKFFLQNGMEAEMIYHNNQVVFTHAELQAYDRITVGKTKLLFLPLCGERFSWEENTVGEKKA